MSGHILIIEDNPDNSKLICWMLEDEGYSVTCVESAERGLELLHQRDFSLILMDISLPGINGKEATRRIRHSPHLQSIPILALTAHAIEAERRSILDSGVNAVLTKPVNEEQLLTQIRHYLTP